MIAVGFVDMNGGLCEKKCGQLVYFQSEMCSVAFDGVRPRCGETTGAKAGNAVWPLHPCRLVSHQMSVR